MTTKATVDRALLEQALYVIDAWGRDRDHGLYWRDLDDAVKALRAALTTEVVEPESVSVFGVKPNGEMVDTGMKVPMPPRMKAKELARETFGAWADDDGSDGDMCFAVCEQFLEWLVAQGWKAAPQPAPSPVVEPVAEMCVQRGRPVLLKNAPMLADKQPLYTSPQPANESRGTSASAQQSAESAYQRGYMDGTAKPCTDCADYKRMYLKVRDELAELQQAFECKEKK